jgi:hypothetical protein
MNRCSAILDSNLSIGLLKVDYVRASIFAQKICQISIYVGRIISSCYCSQPFTIKRPKIKRSHNTNFYAIILNVIFKCMTITTLHHSIISLFLNLKLTFHHICPICAPQPDEKNKQAVTSAPRFKEFLLSSLHNVFI